MLLLLLMISDTQIKGSEDDSKRDAEHLNTRNAGKVCLLWCECNWSFLIMSVSDLVSSAT
jgi:hypothetical protein